MTTSEATKLAVLHQQRNVYFEGHSVKLAETSIAGIIWHH